MARVRQGGTVDGAPGRDDELVLAIDIGGTATKALLLDRSGRVHGHATAPGGNRLSALGDVSTYLRVAIATALGGRSPTAVRATAAGIAGAASAMAETTARVRADLGALGVHGPLDVRADLDIAFLAGAPDGEGVLLLSGTGAVAGRYREGRLVRRCDGLGWRLGDEGSGWWLGDQALRAAVAALDGRGPATDLVQALGNELGVAAPAQLVSEPSPGTTTGSGTTGPLETAGPRDGFGDDPDPLSVSDGPGSLDPRLSSTADVRQEWVRAVAALPPVGAAALTRAVVGCAVAGDAVASDLVEQAVDLLVRDVAVVASGETGLPVVLAGGLLTADGPLGGGVRERLHLAGHHPRVGPPPVLGAAVLACRLVGWTVPDPQHIVVPEPVRA